MKPSNRVDWRNIEGWLYYDEADWLYEQVRILPDLAKIVEVGAWVGRSASAMALGCVRTGKRVFTIDTFKGSREHKQVPPKMRETLKANLERLGVSRYVYIIEGKSLDVARDWMTKDWPGPINFFFLDGDHDDTAADIRAWRPYVRGIFAVHDAAGDGAWENVKQAVDEEFAGLEIGRCCSIAYVDLRGNDEAD